MQVFFAFWTFQSAFSGVPDFATVMAGTPYFVVGDGFSNCFHNLLFLLKFYMMNKKFKRWFEWFSKHWL